ncbi:MAG: diguanylate cyclase [Firmicutes bacterium]|nr:diguanylate cyclase [Bacillota bacterium]
MQALTELLAMYDVTSFSYPRTADDLLAELVEKSSRLFGAQRVALALPGDNEQLIELTWGFKNPAEVPLSQADGRKNCFLYYFQPDRTGFLYLECKHALSAQERRLGLMLARTVEGIIQQKKVRDDLEAAKQEKAVILDSLAEQLLFTDRTRTIKWANASAARSVGLTADQLVGKYCYEVIKGQEMPCKQCPALKIYKTKEPLHYTATSAKGRVLDVRASPVKGEDGTVKGILQAITDITEQVRAQEALRLSEARYRQIVDTLQEGYYETDVRGNITFCNDAACRLLGFEPGSLTGKNFRHLVHNPQAAVKTFKDIYATKEPCRGLVLKLKHKTSKLRFAELSITPIKNREGEITGFCGVAWDITERKMREEKLEYLSWHDALTGLFNRAWFEQQLEKLDSNSFPITVLTADLDGLKLVNDTMGHHHGDKLLKTCANILQGSIRAGDLVARIGGDEFAAILTKTEEKAAKAVIKRIRLALADHNEQNPQLPLSLSIGVATSYKHEPILETFKKADGHMLGNKLHRSIRKKSQLVHALSAALAERDYTTKLHAERLQDLCPRLGQRVGLSEREQANLALLAKVHDLGKVGVPDSILFKRGPLTAEEREIMEQHPEKGYRIAGSSPEIAHIARYVLCHHERWDGKGYPLGLKGEEIPLKCRILALADAYDAMTSDRPYRKAMSRQEALAEIKRCAGTQFDPRLAKEFIRMIKEEHG